MNPQYIAESAIYCGSFYILNLLHGKSGDFRNFSI